MTKYFYKVSLVLFITMLLADVSPAWAADADSMFVPTRRRRPKPIRKEWSFGFRLNSDGWGIFYDNGKVKSEERNSDYFYNIRLIQVEFDEKKHPSEIKGSNNLSTGESTKPVIFGKINNFYTLKFGYGKRKMIAGKPDPGSISIHWVYLGGISLGLEKPYYIDAFVDEGGVLVQKTIKYADTNSADFVPFERERIIGSSGFSQGIGETKFIPGAHFKTALHFDFASSKKTKMAIETGLNAEIYTRAINMMVNKDAVPYFVNVYASFQIGKRKQ